MSRDKITLKASPEEEQARARKWFNRSRAAGPSLLQLRVEEFSIPAWPGEAVFGRILVYRLPDKASSRKTYLPDGVIEVPDDQKSNAEFRSPRDIIVSAGLQAMDILRGNGIGLGDIIWMSSYTPWRFEVDKTKDGKSVEFFFMQAGDVSISEDLHKRLLDGKLQVEIRDGKHQLRAEDGEVPRFDPFQHPDEI